MTRIGLLVSTAAGAVSAIALLFALQGMVDVRAVQSAAIPIRLVAAGLFVGFIAARGLTNEVDKVLLRLAVRSAATAPAAHPAIAQAIEHAPPWAVFEIAADLAPRPRPSPLERLRVAPGFERAHAQRL